MFTRTNLPDSVIWPRFRSGTDGFVFGRRGPLFEAFMVLNADRAVELGVALVEHLTPAVELSLDDWRTGDLYHGTDLANADVRDALSRARHALSSLGGIEVTVTGGDEQVTLTPNLELWVFAPTDRWLYLLQGKGLRRRRGVRSRSWHLERGEFGPGPGAAVALQVMAERLGLEVHKTPAT